MQNASTISLTEEKSNQWYVSGWWPYVWLAVSCALLYGCTLWYGFSPTDERWIIIQERGHLSDFSNVPLLFKSSMLGMYYRPMLSFSLMLDMLAGNGDTFNFHLTNVLLHIGCCLLVFRFFNLLGFEKITALIIAMLFAVHPVNVHAVAWIPGRNDTLLTLFTLLSCITLLRYVRDEKLYALPLHLLFFIGALFTKESAIVLPVIYLLIFLFFAKDKRKIRVAFFVVMWIVLTAGWWTIRSEVSGNVASFLTTFNGKNILDFFSALVLHTGKILLPVQQSVMPMLDQTVLWPFAIVILATIVLAVKFGVKNKKMALFGLTWFIILIVLPAWTGAVNGNGEHYEHRDYTPLPGALLFLSQINIPFSKTMMQRIFVVIILAFGIKTFLRLPVYKDEFSYAKAGTIEAPSSSLFHDVVGTIYSDKKKYKEAVGYFTNAIKIDSLNTDYYSHRAETYVKLNDFKDALADDNKAITIDSTLPDIYLHRSIVLFQLGEFVKARTDLKKAADHGGYATEEFIKVLSDSLTKKHL
jgi:hypothetical protein